MNTQEIGLDVSVSISTDSCYSAGTSSLEYRLARSVKLPAVDVAPLLASALAFSTARMDPTDTKYTVLACVYARDPHSGDSGRAELRLTIARTIKPSVDVAPLIASALAIMDMETAARLANEAETARVQSVDADAA